MRTNGPQSTVQHVPALITARTACCSNTAAARNLAQITEGRCLSSHMSTILMASSGVQWKNHHYHDYFQPELLSLHYQFLLAGGWNIFPPQLVLVLWNQDFLQSVKYCFFWRASSWKAKMETVSRGSKFWAPLFHKWSLQSCNISKPPVTRSEPCEYLGSRLSLHSFVFPFDDGNFLFTDCDW